MSSRAIRALRGAAVVPEMSDPVSDDEEEPQRRKPAFLFDSDSSDDEDDGSEPVQQEAVISTDNQQESNADDDEDEPKKVASKKIAAARAGKVSEEEEDDYSFQEDEDLDALLSEFQEQDAAMTQRVEGQTNNNNDDEGISSRCPFALILRGLDARDLDYDYSMRTSVLGGGSTTTHASRQHRKGGALLFGPPRDGWAARPPRLVGGGLGMATTTLREPPWPYNAVASSSSAAAAVWCTFVHSDSYQRDVDDYNTVIRQSGDLNALVMFVAHHPFVMPALLQLVTVLYQTNHSQEGLALLRRCLWICESAALPGFAGSILQPDCGKAVVFHMDKDRVENTAFFESLFRLVQVSSIAGLSRTAFAAARLLLSLDPLRDPMRMLLALDRHALSVGLGSAIGEQQKQILGWLIDLVESNLIRIWHRSDYGETHDCDIRDLPNWTYSYALALFHWSKIASLQDNSDDAVASAKKRADEAIQAAMGRFPNAVGLLLQHLEVDTAGRSFRRDWVTVLDFAADRSRRLAREWHAAAGDAVVLSATMRACDLILRIYVQNTPALLHWGDDAVLQWVYDNLRALQQRDSETAELPPAPSPAVVRYADADPADFDNKIQQLPQDANIVDPGLVEHAMVMNPNRPRFLRMANQHRGRGGGDDFDDRGFVLDAHGNRVARNPQRFMGPPTELVDPDWPIVEVFWRSFLPWNHVEGVPPPRR